MNIMALRVLIACLGALVVTTTLLFLMNSAISIFRNRDQQHYFRITDILPKPDPGRPDRPDARPRQPNLPAAPGTSTSGRVIEVQPPSVPAPVPLVSPGPPGVITPDVPPDETAPDPGRDERN